MEKMFFIFQKNFSEYISKQFFRRINYFTFEKKNTLIDKTFNFFGHFFIEILLSKSLQSKHFLLFANSFMPLMHPKLNMILH